MSVASVVMGFHLDEAHLILTVFHHGLAVEHFLLGRQLLPCNLADLHPHLSQLLLLPLHGWLEDLLQPIQLAASLTLEDLVGSLQLGCLCARYLFKLVEIDVVDGDGGRQEIFHVLGREREYNETGDMLGEGEVKKGLVFGVEQDDLLEVVSVGLHCLILHK